MLWEGKPVCKVLQERDEKGKVLEKSYTLLLQTECSKYRKESKRIQGFPALKGWYWAVKRSWFLERCLGRETCTHPSKLALANRLKFQEIQQRINWVFSKYCPKMTLKDVTICLKLLTVACIVALSFHWLQWVWKALAMLCGLVKMFG